MTVERCENNVWQEGKVVPSSTLYEWQRKLETYFQTFLPQVENGIYTVREFCEGVGLLTAEAQSMIAYSSPSFDEWRRAVQQHFPKLEDAAFEHERAHAEVAERYGLKVLFQVMVVRLRIFGAVSESPQLLIDDGLENTATEWPPEQLLRYYKEVLSAPGDDMSDMDKVMLPS